MTKPHLFLTSTLKFPIVRASRFPGGGIPPKIVENPPYTKPRQARPFQKNNLKKKSRCSLIYNLIFAKIKHTN